MKTIETVADVKEAMQLSRRFENNVNEWIYDDLMEMQRLDYEEIKPEGLKYHDYYTSFFYTLENAEKFIDSLVDCENWYFSEHAKPIQELINRWNDMEYYSEEYDQMEEQINQEAEKLMHNLENYLQQYENPDQFMIDDCLENMLDNNCFENYYIDGQEVKLYHPARAAYYESI